MVDRLHQMGDSKIIVPSPVKDFKEKQNGNFSIGSCDDAIREARDLMSKDGHDFNYLRVVPILDEVENSEMRMKEVCDRQNRDTTKKLANRDLM